MSLDRPLGNLEIRPAAVADTPAIQRHVAAIYADYGDVLDVQNEDRHLRDPGEYFRATGGEFWVVMEQGMLIATGAILIADGVAEVRTIYVRKDHRGRGLGRELTRMAIAYAAQRGFDEVYLWSDKRYTEAHRLYESLGFVRIGERDVRITNAYSEWRYRLSLRNASNGENPQ